MTKRFMTLQQFHALAGAYAERAEEQGVAEAEINSWLIGEMNNMYDLPVNDVPSLYDLGKDTYITRMQGFLKTLQDEMDEGKLIMVAMQILKQFEDGERQSITTAEVLTIVNGIGVNGKAADKFVSSFMSYVNRNDLEIEQNIEKFILVSLADWFADMNVFNTSESAKYGIPLDAVFKIVMASNFTKLDEDGMPIKDANGKFLKGPNYIAPEEHIEALLFHSSDLLSEYYAQRQELDEYAAVTIPLLSTEVAPIFEGEDEDAEDEEDEQ